VPFGNCCARTSALAGCAVRVTATNQSQQEAEHKEEVKQFHTFASIGMGLKDLILKAIDDNFLLEI
jgi:hypothetical protein